MPTGPICPVFEARSRCKLVACQAKPPNPHALKNRPSLHLDVSRKNSCQNLVETAQLLHVAGRRQRFRIQPTLGKHGNCLEVMPELDHG